jgi:23S rRNA (cytidine1920-2'-O)/16S rRNA (cytidine1409-2'-O)-methyltransferase
MLGESRRIEAFREAIRALAPGRVVADLGCGLGTYAIAVRRAGAARVYALDVGYGQLAHRLRADARVVVLDRTNVRTLDAARLPERVGLATVDVSFISLEKVLPPVFASMAPAGQLIALVKPQFELGKGAVGKGGVVRDQAQHQAVVARLARFSVLRGRHVLGVTASPLKGAKGNREFFLHLSQHGRTASNLEGLIARSVEAFA